MTRLLPFALLALALAGCSAPDAGAPAGAGAQSQPAAAPASKPAEAPAAGANPGVVAQTAALPRLQARTVAGEDYDLAGHRGKWVVVNFWATWCAPCLQEMPELSALHAMRDNVEVVGLAYEDIEPDDMRAFLEKHPVAYPIVILDPYDPPQDFATPRGLPMTYLIAPDGKVAHQFLGPVDAGKIEQAIAEAGGKVG
ncbi:TlpA family protein disulfide reductase [Stenotrophomonas acidaminiphila]|uniref:TlpA family protein disulfide reductase n=1 Tax=Stenotrophomonas acidaminiphila TaxID=128780 RepID=UPI00135244C7|nr:TlpA family protein disulfide reductase [Stenotrophomonas sp.]NCT86046.1 TlpA family protein disulfide reductase [Stenotrophomonas acidaminiphila]